MNKRHLRPHVLAVLLLTSVVSTVGCDKKSSPSSTTETPFLLQETMHTRGAAIAACVERTSALAYAAKEQEYGYPGKQQDTFVRFDPSSQTLHFAMLGSSKSVDGAKERVTARLPTFEKALELCVFRAGGSFESAKRRMLVSYNTVDRKQGTLKTAIFWRDGKFDFPPDAAPAAVWDWLQAPLP